MSSSSSSELQVGNRFAPIRFGLEGSSAAHRYLSHSQVATTFAAQSEAIAALSQAIVELEVSMFVSHDAFIIFLLLVRFPCCTL